MDERKISLLEQMTVARGASPNEERIAQEKIAKYAQAMNKPKPGGELGHFWKLPDEDKPLHEQMFLKRWYELKMANRKKWGA